MADATLVKPGSPIKLARRDPDDHGDYQKDDPVVVKKLTADLESMSGIQERLYAEGKQSLLIVLQAMDAGGKDGTIRHVMRAFNPSSCYVVSFKVPTVEEASHDFLWRIHHQTPRAGMIAVFNRSHYEDVLVARVRKLVPSAVWKARYAQINAFERHLAANGTRIVKFFLHISKDEQRKRLQERLEDPSKHWKFSSSDLEERKLWDAYQEAYEEALSRCSTEEAPWHVIPANKKWYRNLLVADVIERTLRSMRPKWPESKVDLTGLTIPE
jgi:PPK2 family polyphosphate:nucleotide phosphotransferase